VPAKKKPQPKISIPKKWLMPNRPGSTGRIDTLPIRPGDKPGTRINLSKTIKATNRRTAR
jgi:hypothetical protein